MIEQTAVTIGAIILLRDESHKAKDNSHSEDNSLLGTCAGQGDKASIFTGSSSHGRAAGCT